MSSKNEAESKKTNHRNDELQTSFSAASLIRSHSNINHVIDAFLCETRNKVEEEDKVVNLGSEETQRDFAQMVGSIVDEKDGRFLPSVKYISQLVKRFVSRAEREYGMDAIRDEDLIEIMTRQFTAPSSCTGDIPNPNESCCVSFQIPTTIINERSTRIGNGDDMLIGIRVYPYHNDVGVRKVWEAGACLAEFLLKNPHYVKDKVIVELGAGVGLTGIVIAKMCSPKHVFMTDYTAACMQNLDHNIIANEPYPASSLTSDTKNISATYLEWTQYAQTHEEEVREHKKQDHIQIDFQNNMERKNSTNKMSVADIDVLIAADVVYDVNELPSLVKTVFQLLTSGQGKIAVFATTLRNKRTFQQFETLLSQSKIKCSIIPSHEIQTLPMIFPCYEVQPRSDVQICLMTVLDYS